ncbi:MAG: hypothetical protein HZB61_10820 [Nitrospirae bacterium]|nr:hypothetical protein [Nitrospirota bacterium]
MVFDVEGEVISAGISQKGKNWVNLLVSRPDKSGKDVIMVFAKQPGQRPGEVKKFKCSALVKMAFEV